MQWRKVELINAGNQSVATNGNVEKAVPPQRYCHTATTSACDEIFVFAGGIEDAAQGSNSEPASEYINDMWKLDTENLVWEKVNAIGTGPTGRLGHSACLIGKKIYYFGGYEESLKNDMFSFDTETYEWTQINAGGNVPLPRSQHSACVNGNKMYVFGGYAGAEKNDIYVYDADKNEWSELITKGTAPVPRYQHTSCFISSQNKLLVFGGFDGNQKCLGDVFTLNLATMEWSEAKPKGTCPSPQGGHRTCVFENTMLCFGGEGDDDKKRNDVFVLDFDTMEWSVADIPDGDDGERPQKRYCHSISLLSTGEMVVFGGRDGDNNLYNDSWVLDTKLKREYEFSHDFSALFATTLSTTTTTSSSQASNSEFCDVQVGVKHNCASRSSSQCSKEARLGGVYSRLYSRRASRQMNTNFAFVVSCTS